MCGIIGYIGNKHPKDVLLNGLKALEYRGYDSAGIALKKDEEIQVIKSVGQISNLENKINEEKIIPATMGIAHTRWATHGEANLINAHPHTVGKVTLVHNGIIENAIELKEELKKEGYQFKSDTDTEVISALIDKYYKKDPVEAIQKAIDTLKGSYALAIIFNDVDKVYAVRKESPLIVGEGIKENFVASDLIAIIDYTNKYYLLEEKEIAEVSAEKIIFYKDGKKINKKVLTTDLEVTTKDKCGYEHYMLKEIMEEPVVLENTLKPYMENINLIPDISDYEEVHIIGCGSALYAGMIGKTLLEENTNLRVVCEVASEYRYRKVLYDRRVLVIVISQSGETADTIAALRKAKKAGAHTLGIVNVEGSTIARESDKVIFIKAGVEVAVATTKAYILQVAILGLIALVSSHALEEASEELKMLPKLLKKVIDEEDIYKNIAKEIYKSEHIFFIGRKIDYAIALEGSLKLKEVSYIHSEAYQAGELKHGTISLIEKNTPVFAIMTDGDVMDKTISNTEEVLARGAKVIVISNTKKTDFETIEVPKINKFFQPVLVVPTLQLIAYWTAKMRKCEIDMPKNLAKSVTVE